MIEATITEGYLLTKKFTNANEFSIFIEQYCVKNRLSYMDAVIDFCSKNDVELESIGPMISKSLKEKIRVEAEEANFFKAKGKLNL